MTIETKRSESRDDVGDLASGVLRKGWRQHCRLSGWGVETTPETWWLWNGEEVGDLVAGEWR